MKRQSFIFKDSGKRQSWLLVVCFIAIVCCSQSLLAQSGRRQSKSVSTTPPPVVAEPQSESKNAPPTVKPSSSASVIVSGDVYGSSLYLTSSYVDEAMRACIDRLKNSTGLEVVGGGNMNRKGAIDRAKKETTAFVLWLEIREENDGSDLMSIGYVVYLPQTAKVLTSGRVYPGSKGAGTGGVIVGVPTVTRRLPVQYLLKEGGQQVADRVRGKLRVTTPD